MKYLYLFNIMNFILSTFSANNIIPKFCKDCKFYKKDNIFFFMNSKFGKCSLFPLKNEINYFLVDGNKDKKYTNYVYCSIARNNNEMCGEEAKHFINKKV